MLTHNLDRDLTPGEPKQYQSRSSIYAKKCYLIVHWLPFYWDRRLSSIRMHEFVIDIALVSRAAIHPFEPSLDLTMY